MGTLAAGLVIGVFGACTTPTAGTPTPGTPTTGPVRSPFLDVRGLDPCSGLTVPQASALGLGEPTFEPSSGIGGASCTWLRGAEPPGGYYVEANDHLDVSEWATYPAGSPHFTVAGFDAIIGRTRTADVTRTCQVVVGVAEGQIVEVAYTYRGHDPVYDRAAVCRQARTVAEMVMQTLVARAGG